MNTEKMTGDEFEYAKEHQKIETLIKVKRAIKRGETTFIDDHTGKEEKLEAVVILDNSYICPVDNGGMSESE